MSLIRTTRFTAVAFAVARDVTAEQGELIAEDG